MLTPTSRSVIPNRPSEAHFNDRGGGECARQFASVRLRAIEPDVHDVAAAFAHGFIQEGSVNVLQ